MLSHALKIALTVIAMATFLIIGVWYEAGKDAEHNFRDGMYSR